MTAVKQFLLIFDMKLNLMMMKEVVVWLLMPATQSSWRLISCRARLLRHYESNAQTLKGRLGAFPPFFNTSHVATQSVKRTVNPRSSTSYPRLLTLVFLFALTSFLTPCIFVRNILDIWTTVEQPTPAPSEATDDLGVNDMNLSTNSSSAPSDPSINFKGKCSPGINGCNGEETGDVKIPYTFELEFVPPGTDVQGTLLSSITQASSFLPFCCQKMWDVQIAKPSPR